MEKKELTHHNSRIQYTKKMKPYLYNLALKKSGSIFKKLSSYLGRQLESWFRP